MDRRAFIGIVGGSILASPLVTRAQEAAKTYRIGWLAYGWTEGAERTSPEFVQELKKHLQNFVLKFRGHRDAERMPGLARELVQLGVDVIVANGTVAAQARHCANSRMKTPVATINTTVVLRGFHGIGLPLPSQSWRFWVLG